MELTLFSIRSGARKDVAHGSVGPERPHLIDHLVGAGEQGRRHGQPKRLGGVEIDGKLELDRLLHRQIARFCTAQDPIDVTGGSPVEIRDFDAVSDQPAAPQIFLS